MFPDTNKGLPVTCIQDTAKGVPSVTDFEFCGDFLVKRLLECPTDTRGGYLDERDRDPGDTVVEVLEF